MIWWLEFRRVLFRSVNSLYHVGNVRYWYLEKQHRYQPPCYSSHAVHMLIHNLAWTWQLLSEIISQRLVHQGLRKCRIVLIICLGVCCKVRIDCFKHPCNSSISSASISILCLSYNGITLFDLQHFWSWRSIIHFWLEWHHKYLLLALIIDNLTDIDLICLLVITTRCNRNFWSSVLNFL